MLRLRGPRYRAAPDDPRGVQPQRAMPRSIEQLTELIGRVSMKELVRDAIDVIERLCIESALELTGNNRASAAEMLGLSRQSLYVKLRRYGLSDPGDAEPDGEGGIVSDQIVNNGGRRRWPGAAGNGPGVAQSAGSAGAAQTDHMVRPHLGLWLRHCLRRWSWRTRLGRRRGRRRAGGAARLRHQPGRERLVRSPCRCHQRAESGRYRRAALPGQWGFGIAVGWTILTVAVSFLLGAPVVIATAIGLVLAWIYSAPPIRLKRNGWWSNLAVGLSYEGLPWFAGAAVCLRAMPSESVILVALIYSLGAHGIMTLNDFKSIEGDRQMGLGSLPARLGPDRACRLACLTMAAAQAAIVLLLLYWGMPVHACIVVALLTAQLVLMLRLLDDPRGRAPWYNATRHHALRARHARHRLRPGAAMTAALPLLGVAVMIAVRILSGVAS